MSDNSKINQDDCRAYLEKHVFKLREKNYSVKYPIWPGEVGLEIEAFPFSGPLVNQLTKLKPDKKAFESVGEHGTDLTSALCSLGSEKGWSPKLDSYVGFDHQEKQIVPLITLEDGDNISFEPGGQLEHSTIPYPCLSDAARRVRKLQDLLDTHLNKLMNAQLRQIGYNPYQTVEEIGLQMDKKRYLAMDDYFSRIGPWGRRMMRLACTIQVCLDFGPDEETMARRFFMAQLISPFVQAMFSYSPFMDGKLADLDGVRAKAWFEIDRSRTGVSQIFLNELSDAPSKFSFSKNKCVESYMQLLLKSNMIFVERADFKVPEKPIQFGQWLEEDIYGLSPMQVDLKTQLTLLFPEVRPKGFLELRSPDSQDRVWQFVPAALYTGLLYDDDTLARAFDLLTPFAKDTTKNLEKACLGLEDQALQDISRKLMALAQEGFAKLPPCFSMEGTGESLSSYADTFTDRGLTPARVLRNRLVAAGTDKMDDKVWQKLRSEWMVGAN